MLLDLLRVGVFCLSALGYIRLFRQGLKVGFATAAMLWFSSVAIAMLLAGMVGVMKVAALVILVGGAAAAVIPAVLKLRLWQRGAGIPFRLVGEHLFFGAVVPLGALYFYSFKLEQGSGDFWGAWYHQFVYIALHGRWADSGYHNYASAYAMICNGFCYCLTTAAGKTGSATYMVGLFICAVTPLFCLFSAVNFRKVPAAATVLFPVMFFIYKLYPMGVLRTVAAAAAVFLAIYLICRDRSTWRDVAILALMPPAAFLLLAEPMSFWALPMDAVLGCFEVGILGMALTRRDRLFRGFRWWTFMPPLAVLTLIKPTGAFPAVFMAIMLTIIAVYHNLRRVGKRRWISVVAPLLILLAPLAAHRGWETYAADQQLCYQHHMARDWQSTMRRQLSGGMTAAERKEWQSSIFRMCVFFGSVNRPRWYVKYDELASKLIVRLGWNIDGKAGHTGPYPHLLVLLPLLLACTLIAIAALGKRGALGGFWLVGTVVFGAVIGFIQCYAAPMFFGVPGLFRYLWPGTVLFLGLPFLLVGQAIRHGRRWGAILTAAAFVIVFHPFFSNSADDYYCIYENADTGDNLPLYQAAWILFNQPGNGDFYCNANPLREGAIGWLLAHYLNMPEPPRAPWSVDNNGKVVAAVGNRTPPNTWEFAIRPPAAPGIYEGEPTGDGKWSFRPLPVNPDAKKLLLAAYSFDDLTSLRPCAPVEIPINGNFSTRNNPDEERMFVKGWAVYYKGGNLLTLPPAERDRKIELLPRLFKGNRIRLSPGEEAILLMISQEPLFCFANDKIELSGECGDARNFSLQVIFADKVGDVYKTRSEIQVPVAFDGDTFRAGCDFAEIPPEQRGEYYRLQFVFPRNFTNTISDLKLIQRVSGRSGSPPPLSATPLW